MYIDELEYRRWFENFARRLRFAVPDDDFSSFLADDFIKLLSSMVTQNGGISTLLGMDNLSGAENLKTTSLRNQAREGFIVQFFGHNPLDDQQSFSKDGRKRVFGVTFALLRALQFKDTAEGQKFFEEYLVPRARLWAEKNYFEGMEDGMLAEVPIAEEDLGKKFVAVGPQVLFESVRLIVGR